MSFKRALNRGKQRSSANNTDDTVQISESHSKMLGTLCYIPNKHRMENIKETNAGQSVSLEVSGQMSPGHSLNLKLLVKFSYQPKLSYHLKI